MDGKDGAGAGLGGGDINIDLVTVLGVIEPATAGPGWLYLIVMARGVVLGSACPELVRNCLVVGPLRGCGWGICFVVKPVMSWGWNCAGMDWGAGWLYLIVTGWYCLGLGFCNWVGLGA